MANLRERDAHFLPAWLECYAEHFEEIYLSVPEHGEYRFWNKWLEFYEGSLCHIHLIGNSPRIHSSEYYFASDLDCFMHSEDISELLQTHSELPEPHILDPCVIEHYFDFNCQYLAGSAKRWAPKIVCGITRDVIDIPQDVTPIDVFVYRYRFVGNERTKEFIKEIGETHYLNTWQIWENSRDIDRAIAANCGAAHVYARYNSLFKGMPLVRGFDPEHPAPIKRRLKFFTEEVTLSGSRS